MDEVVDNGGAGVEGVDCMDCMRDIGVVGRGEGVCCWKDWLWKVERGWDGGGFKGILLTAGGTILFPSTRLSKSSVVSSIGPNVELSCMGDEAVVDMFREGPNS